MFTVYSHKGEPLFTGTYAEVSYWVARNGLDGVSRIIAI